jgi:hypothetical protein
MVIADYHLQYRTYVFVMKISVSEGFVRFCALDFSGQDRYTMYKVKHMLTITAEAKAYALENGGSLFLEYVTVTGGCCIPYQPEPAVRLGKPRKQDQYRQESLDGLTIFIPHRLPEEELAIAMVSFLGFKKLVIEGWRYY